MFYHNSCFVMTSTHQFYLDTIKTHTLALVKAKRKLLWSSMARFFVFLTALGCGYAFFNTPKILFAVVILAMVLFVFLVSRHTDLKYSRDKLLELIAINETELKVLQGDFSHLPSGDEFKSGNHDFTQDIDMFGANSFFQYFNRTSLHEGTVFLADLLSTNMISDIPNKQEAVKELSGMTGFRQNFGATAKRINTITENKTILQWIAGYEPGISKKYIFIPALFSTLSALTGVGYVYFTIPGEVLFGVFLSGLILTGVHLSRINKIATHTAKVQDTFEQYGKLMELITQQNFTSEMLKKQAFPLQSDLVKVGKEMARFSGYLSKLDQRNNMLFGVVANAFLLWDIRQCYAIEQWLKQNKDAVASWFKAVSFFDAYASLGNFDFNHKSFVYPSIAQNAGIQFESLAHPLLTNRQPIPNTFNAKKDAFFIITGANMAGKSTFLRSVSLSIVMANCGLPIYASSAVYTPIKLITSMRTEDSLAKDQSYFFSELNRLKYIVEKLQVDRYFVVLDEILKGTNSDDKAEGSRQFVEKLVKTSAMGLVATHDLSLCVLSDALGAVKNYHFDAQIKDDELYFDYTLKEGVSKTKNASFLLKKMGIV